jgi:hypothetical protein
VRYRTGDIVRVTSIGNANIGSELPQIVHYGRTGRLVEIGGFVRLTEDAISAAIARASVPHVGWSARKEVEGSNPVVHLRIEPPPGPGLAQAEALERIDEALGAVDRNWADMAAIAGLRPLRVTYLPSGSFARYIDYAAVGARMASGEGGPFHLVNPNDGDAERLIEAAVRAIEAR